MLSSRSFRPPRPRMLPLCAGLVQAKEITDTMLSKVLYGPMERQCKRQVHMERCSMRICFKFWQRMYSCQSAAWSFANLKRCSLAVCLCVCEHDQSWPVSLEVKLVHSSIFSPLALSLFSPSVYWGGWQFRGTCLQHKPRIAVSNDTSMCTYMYI